MGKKITPEKYKTKFEQRERQSLILIRLFQHPQNIISLKVNL